MDQLPSLKRGLRRSKKRKRSGQPGHKGKNRDLIPSSEVDLVEKILPAVCEHWEFRGRKILPLSGGGHSRGQAARDGVSAPLHPVRVWGQNMGGASAQRPVRIRASADSLCRITAVHRVTRRGLMDIFKTVSALTSLWGRSAISTKGCHVP
jgi:hypothetical protein